MCVALIPMSLPTGVTIEDEKRSSNGLLEFGVAETERIPSEVAGEFRAADREGLRLLGVLSACDGSEMEEEEKEAGVGVTGAVDNDIKIDSEETDDCTDDLSPEILFKLLSLEVDEIGLTLATLEEEAMFKVGIDVSRDDSNETPALVIDIDVGAVCALWVDIKIGVIVDEA
ncbi:hypothetical protein NX059_008065 [Plenodomus lindquistii]|nr:hypothetical protein NX059_008065 [Plenodomus lindquistii]